MSAQATVVRAETLGTLKCPRCAKWNYTLNYQNLCNRCVHVLLTQNKDHDSVKNILENLQLRGLEPKDNPEYKE